MTLSSKSLLSFQAHLGYTFKNQSLLIQALTHKSALSTANDRLLNSNERLEFLGDAVLDLIMGDLLMRTFSNEPEGGLTKKRASLVNEKSLSQIALALKLDQYLQLGKPEFENHLYENERILCSCFEALIGALYMDGGFQVAFTISEALFSPKIEEVQLGHSEFEDFKTKLQECLQKKYHQTPQYKLVGSEGPEHEKLFEVEVLLEDKILAKAKGRNKKIAEQNAAKMALEENYV